MGEKYQGHDKRGKTERCEGEKENKTCAPARKEQLTQKIGKKGTNVDLRGQMIMKTDSCTNVGKVPEDH